MTISKTWKKKHSKKNAEVIYLGRLRIYFLPKDMLEERLTSNNTELCLM